MSVSTEISRLEQAKTSLRSAIIAQGVNVPETEKLDAYAGYVSAINGISAGGSNEYADFKPYNRFSDFPIVPNNWKDSPGAYYLLKTDNKEFSMEINNKINVSVLITNENGDPTEIASFQNVMSFTVPQSGSNYVWLKCNNAISFGEHDEKNILELYASSIAFTHGYEINKNTLYLECYNVTFDHIYQFRTGVRLRKILLDGCDLKRPFGNVFSRGVGGLFPSSLREVFLNNCRINLREKNLLWNENKSCTIRKLEFNNCTFYNSNETAIILTLYRFLVGCYEIEDVSFIDYLPLENVYSMDHAFSGVRCTLDFSTNPITALSGCSLNAAFLDTENVILTNCDFSNVVDWQWVFESSRSDFLYNGDITYPTNMNYAFRNAKSKTIDLSNFIFDNCSYMNNTFNNCQNLENLIFNPNANIKKAIDLSASTLLTHESLLSVINGLGTVTTATTLTLGTANKAKLSSEEIAIATEKGWTIA